MESSHTISSDSHGKRLDRWVRQLSGLPQGAVQRLLRGGKIRVNQKKAEADYRLVEGDEVVLSLDVTEAAPLPKTQTSYKASKEELVQLEDSILWEDENFLVINKPDGLSVQGGSKTTKHVDGLLQAYSLSKGHPAKAYHLVHRLDKETTGVLLIAKGARMAQFISAAFKNNEVTKTYWALVEGAVPASLGEVNAPLGKKGFGAYEKVVVDFEHGKKALTRFRLIKQLKEPKGQRINSWLEATPVTGRTHQIRVHCAYQEHPIVGDLKYGSYNQPTGPLFLHARSLKFRDPEGTLFTIVAPPPPHFERWFQANKVDLQKF